METDKSMKYLSEIQDRYVILEWPKRQAMFCLTAVRCMDNMRICKMWLMSEVEPAWDHIKVVYLVCTPAH